MRPHFLDRELLQLEQYIAYRDAINTEVSKVDVAWHIDHTLKAINGLYGVLRDSNPDEYRFRPRLSWFSLMINYLPRGRAQAPKAVLPPDTILTEDLESQIALARENMATIDQFDRHAFFSNPIFGHLNRRRTKRFIKVHTDHHLKIIRDILKPRN